MGNNLAPGFIRYTYSGSDAPHHEITPIIFASDPVPGFEPEFQNHAGLGVFASVAIPDWVNQIKVFFNGGTQFGLAEVYAVDAVTLERTFIWGMNVNISGSNVAANVPLSEAVMSFKTVGGGKFKVYLMEGTALTNTRLSFGEFDTVLTNFAEFVTGPDCCVYGQDNTAPFIALFWTTKTSDPLRRQQGLA
jgi:hypothetical protein